MNILMLSSSRAGDEPYLNTARPLITTHLKRVEKALFIPFAGVTIAWDDYTRQVQQSLPEIDIQGLHQFDDAVSAIDQAEAVLIGGGNTFNLLHQLYQQQLMVPLAQRVANGMPYVGWSAGSNICGNSIRTTNDMPIIQPASFAALNLVPFQLNPHFTDFQPPGHAGETRAQRIAEFCKLNPTMPVIGIREGSALSRKHNTLTLLGSLPADIFLAQKHWQVEPHSDLSEFLSL